MAQLSKKIHIQKTNGTLQTCCLYSAKSDIPDKALPLTVDGSTCYAALVAASDSRATGGRVQPTGGAVYALATEAKRRYTITVAQPSNASISINGQVGTSFTFDEGTSITISATATTGHYISALYVSGNAISNPCTITLNASINVYANTAISYTETNYTSAQTAMFTVPTGVNRLRVAVCGGGGGGCSMEDSSYSINVSGKAGGGSSFGSLSVGGGSGATSLRTFGSAGSPDVSPYPDAGYALSFDTAAGSFGAGGRNLSTGDPMGYGGNGGYLSTYITVSGGQQIIVIVGAGGAAGNHITRGGYNTPAQDGTAGFVLIAFGQGIQQ